nr:hypothetical protein [Streptomyces noursei]
MRGVALGVLDELGVVLSVRAGLGGTVRVRRRLRCRLGGTGGVGRVGLGRDGVGGRCGLRRLVGGGLLRGVGGAGSAVAWAGTSTMAGCGSGAVGASAAGWAGAST